MTREYKKRQKWPQGGDLEKLGCKMYRVLVNGKDLTRYINQIKKIQNSENYDSQVNISDNTIPLLTLSPSNKNIIKMKQYPNRTCKSFIRNKT